MNPVLAMLIGIVVMMVLIIFTRMHACPALIISAVPVSYTHLHVDEANLKAVVTAKMHDYKPAKSCLLYTSRCVEETGAKQKPPRLKQEVATAFCGGIVFFVALPLIVYFASYIPVSYTHLDVYKRQSLR